MAQERVSMPMASAGILTASSDVKISGIEVDPKMVIIGTFVFVILVKLASIFVTVPI